MKIYNSKERRSLVTGFKDRTDYSSRYDNTHKKIIIDKLTHNSQNRRRDRLCTLAGGTQDTSSLSFGLNMYDSWDNCMNANITTDTLEKNIIGAKWCGVLTNCTIDESSKEEQENSIFNIQQDALSNTNSSNKDVLKSTLGVDDNSSNIESNKEKIDALLVSLANYAKTENIPSLEGYAKTSDIPSLENYVKLSQLNNHYNKDTIDEKFKNMQSQIDDLEDEMETYVKKTDFTNSIQNIQKDIKSINDAIKTFSTKDDMTKIKTKIVEVENKITTDLNTLGNKIKTVDEKLKTATDQLNNKIDNIKNNFNTLNISDEGLKREILATYDKIKDVYSRVKANIDSHNHKEIELNRENINKILNRLESHNQEFNEVNNKVLNNSTGLKQQIKDIVKNSSDIKNLLQNKLDASFLTGYRKTIAGLNDSIEKIKDIPDIARIQETVNSISADVESLKKNKVDVSSLNEINSKVTNMGNQFAALNNEINTTNKIVKSLEVNNSSLEDNITELKKHQHDDKYQDTIEDINFKIANFEKTLEDVNDKFSDKTEINSIKKNINEIKIDIETLEGHGHKNIIDDLSERLKDKTDLIYLEINNLKKHQHEDKYSKVLEKFKDNIENIEDDIQNLKLNDRFHGPEIKRLETKISQLVSDVNNFKVHEHDYAEKNHSHKDLYAAAIAEIKQQIVKLEINSTENIKKHDNLKKSHTTALNKITTDLENLTNLTKNLPKSIQTIEDKNREIETLIDDIQENMSKLQVSGVKKETIDYVEDEVEKILVKIADLKEKQENFSKIGHKHDIYSTQGHKHEPISHKHDDLYTPRGHKHDIYTEKGHKHDLYTEKGHKHDLYSEKDHKHDDIYEDLIPKITERLSGIDSEINKLKNTAVDNQTITKLRNRIVVIESDIKKINVHEHPDLHSKEIEKIKTDLETVGDSIDDLRFNNVDPSVITSIQNKIKKVEEDVTKFEDHDHPHEHEHEHEDIHSEKIKDLEIDIASIKSGIKTLQSKDIDPVVIANINNNISNLTDDITELKNHSHTDNYIEKINNIESKIINIEKDIKDLEKLPRTDPKTVTKLQQDLINMNQDINEIKKHDHEDIHLQDITALKTDMALLKQSVSDIKKTPSVKPETVDNIKDDITAIMKDVSNLKTHEHKDVNNDKIIKLQTSVNEIKSDINVINSKPQYNPTDFANLENKIENLTKDLNGLRSHTHADTNGGKIRVINEQINSIKTDISNIKNHKHTEIGFNTDNIKTLQNEISSIKVDVGALENRPQFKPNEIKIINEKIVKLSNDLNTLKSHSHKDIYKTKIEKINSDLSSLKTDLNNLNSVTKLIFDRPTYDPSVTQGIQDKINKIETDITALNTVSDTLSKRPVYDPSITRGIQDKIIKIESNIKTLNTHKHEDKFTASITDIKEQISDMNTTITGILDNNVVDKKAVEDMKKNISKIQSDLKIASDRSWHNQRRSIQNTNSIRKNAESIRKHFNERQVNDKKLKETLTRIDDDILTLRAHEHEDIHSDKIIKLDKELSILKKDLTNLNNVTTLIFDRPTYDPSRTKSIEDRLLSIDTIISDLRSHKHDDIHSDKIDSLKESVSKINVDIGLLKGSKGAAEKDVENINKRIDSVIANLDSFKEHGHKQLEDDVNEIFGEIKTLEDQLSTVNKTLENKDFLDNVNKDIEALKDSVEDYAKNYYTKKQIDDVFATKKKVQSDNVRQNDFYINGTLRPSLEKQDEKIDNINTQLEAKIKGISDKLKLLEDRKLGISDIKDLQSKLVEIETDLKYLEKVNRDHKHESEHAADIKIIQSKMSNVQREINSLKDSNVKQSVIDDLNSKISNINTKIVKIDSDVSKHSHEDIHSDKINSIETDISGIKIDVKTLKDTPFAKMSDINKIEKSLVDINKNITSLKEHKHEDKHLKDISDIQSKLSKLEKDIVSLNDGKVNPIEIDRLQLKIENINTKITDLKAHKHDDIHSIKIAELQMKIEKLSKDISGINNSSVKPLEISKLKIIIEDIQDDISEIKIHKHEDLHTAKIDKINKDLQNVNSKIVDLEKADIDPKLISQIQENITSMTSDIDTISNHKHEDIHSNRISALQEKVSTVQSDVTSLRDTTASKDTIDTIQKNISTINSEIVNINNAKSSENYDQKIGVIEGEINNIKDDINTIEPSSVNKEVIGNIQKQIDFIKYDINYLKENRNFSGNKEPSRGDNLTNMLLLALLIIFLIGIIFFGIKYLLK